MKKSILLLSSVLLLASCGGTSTNPSDYVEEPKNAKTISGKEAAQHAKKLGTSLSSQKAVGLELTGFYEMSGSFTTVENKELGLSNKEYKSSASIKDLKVNAAYAATDTAVTASASGSAKVVADVNAIRGQYNQETGEVKFVDSSAKLDAGFDAKAFLDQGDVYYDLTGVKDGVHKTVDFVKALTGEDDIKGPEDDYFVKAKTTLPLAITASLASLPAMAGSYVTQYSDYLSQIDVMASTSVQGIDLSKFIETKEYGDGTYGIVAHADVKDVLPLVASTAGIPAQVQKALESVTGSAKVVLDFNESEIKSLGVSLEAGIADLDIAAIAGEDADELPVSKASVSLKAGFKVTFAYGSNVKVASVDNPESYK